MLCLLGPMGAAAVWAAALFLAPLTASVPVLQWVMGGPCLLRESTGIPCPFCGGTRAVAAAARGEWAHSMMLSPVGFLLAVAGPLVGLWLGMCAMTGRDLGLTATGRFLKRRVTGFVFLMLIELLWLYKVIMDCGFGVG